MKSFTTRRVDSVSDMSQHVPKLSKSVFLITFDGFFNAHVSKVRIPLVGTKDGIKMLSSVVLI